MGVEVAEDVVQEVFIRLLQLAEEGKVHFIQNGEVNFFFCVPQLHQSVH